MNSVSAKNDNFIYTNFKMNLISLILLSDPFEIIVNDLNCDDILSLRLVSSQFYEFTNSKLGMIVNSLIDNPQNVDCFDNFELLNVIKHLYFRKYNYPKNRRKHWNNCIYTRR